MKKTFGFGLALLTLVVLLALPAAAGDKVTLTGEIIDSACYIANGASGDGHRDCAQKCADKGIPLALLTDGDQQVVWLSDADHTPANDTLREHAGHKVKVTGELSERGGAKLLVIESVEPAA